MKTIYMATMLLLISTGFVSCETIATTAKAYISDGTVMVPMRAIFEWLGADIAFDSGVITATRGETTVVLQAGHKDATVNGETKSVGMTPVERNGTTYIPLRFVSEAMGAEVAWDAKSKQVSVTDNERVGTVQVTEANDSAKPANTHSYLSNTRIAAGKWVGECADLKISFYVGEDGAALVPSRLLGGFSFRIDSGTPGEVPIGSKKKIAIAQAHGKRPLPGFSFSGHTTYGRLLVAGDFTSPTAWAGKFSLVDKAGTLSMKFTASWKGAAK